MTLKSKRFRIAVEGATTDGRNISREWLTQMAKNYNPSVYGARVNLEHIKGYHPDSSFRRFGDVTGLTRGNYRRSAGGENGAVWRHRTNRRPGRNG